MADEGHNEMQAILERVRALGKLGEAAAPDVARVVEADLRRSISQGTTPDGVKWQPRQDGEQPLRDAASELHVAAVGGTVYVRLTGPEARHHLGVARGRIKREVIPTGSHIPDRMAAGIRSVLDQHFVQVSRG